MKPSGQQNPRRGEGPLLRRCVACRERLVSALVASTTQEDKVRERRRTLYRAAKADPQRRFHALYDKVHRRDVLERAWDQVRRNRGAAGIDHITLAQVEQYGVARLLDELAAHPEDEQYRPLLARRVFIPKPGSGSGGRSRSQRCATASCRRPLRWSSSRSLRPTSCPARSAFD